VTWRRTGSAGTSGSDYHQLLVALPRLYEAASFEHGRAKPHYRAERHRRAGEDLGG
jgi:hypothetical protein